MVDSVAVGPVGLTSRIKSLDVLRGVAVLGILLMNIPFMGMLGDVARPALPVVANADWVAFYTDEILFSGVMRGLFTLLFGAGMLIMLRRADEGGASVQAYLVRCFALMIIGVANFAIFMWPGEILFAYGAVGLVLILFRNASLRLLWTAGIACLLLLTVYGVGSNLERITSLREAPAAMAAKAEGATLTPEQEAAVALAGKVKASSHPDPAKLEAERQKRVTLAGVLDWSSKLWFQFNMSGETRWWLLESLGFMLIGMALYQTGVLTGARSTTFYVWLALLGCGVGIAIRSGVSAAQFAAGFELTPDYALLKGLTYQIGRLPMTLGMLSLVILLLKAGLLGKLAGVLQAVGRMALTNYVGQSIITSVLFYGFGLLGQFSFSRLMAIAVAIWVFQSIASVLWLRVFTMGPLEWLLRSLSYGTWALGGLLHAKATPVATVEQPISV